MPGLSLADLKPGSFVDVSITQAVGYDLIGTVIACS
jgi:hypothetical protein